MTVSMQKNGNGGKTWTVGYNRPGSPTSAANQVEYPDFETAWRARNELIRGEATRQTLTEFQVFLMEDLIAYFGHISSTVALDSEETGGHAAMVGGKIFWIASL